MTKPENCKSECRCAYLTSDFATCLGVVIPRSAKKLREIGAIARQHESRKVVPVSLIGALVEQLNQFVILLFRGCDLEAVDFAIVGFPYQQSPLSAGSISMGAIRGQGLEVATTVIIAKFTHSLGVCNLGNLSGVVNRIEICGEGYGNPIVSGNLVVAADDDAVLPGNASAQNERRLRAHSGEIHGRVSSGIEPAEVAVRLFKKQCDVGPGTQGRKQNQRAQNPKPLFPHFRHREGIDSG
jgi:hypothetical protein